VIKRHPFVASALAGLAVLVLASGCNVTTAHLSDISMASDNAMTTPATTFGPSDTIYATTSVQNNIGKVQLHWFAIAVDAKGISPNFKITGADLTQDISSDATGKYKLSPSATGWPAGTYKIEVDMLVDGDTKDSKTAQFTVR
jgi:hypothetical protein